MHPEASGTELSRHLTQEVLEKLIAEINASQPKGAAPFSYKSISSRRRQLPVWARLRGRRRGDRPLRYCEDCHVAEVASAPGLPAWVVQPYALDPQRARALWQKSEELVGERL